VRLNDAYLRVPRSLDSYQSVPRNHQVSTQVPVASKLQAPTGRGVEADAEATLDKLTVVSDVSDEDRAGELEQVRETEDSLLQSGQDGDVEEGAKSPRSTSLDSPMSREPHDLTEEDFANFHAWTIAQDVDSMEVMLAPNGCDISVRAAIDRAKRSCDNLMMLST
jgi:hypothetical protein